MVTYSEKVLGFGLDLASSFALFLTSNPSSNFMSSVTLKFFVSLVYPSCGTSSMFPRHKFMVWFLASSSLMQSLATLGGEPYLGFVSSDLSKFDAKQALAWTAHERVLTHLDFWQSSIMVSSFMNSFLCSLFTLPLLFKLFLVL